MINGTTVTTTPTTTTTTVTATSPTPTPMSPTSTTTSPPTSTTPRIAHGGRAGSPSRLSPLSEREIGHWRSFPVRQQPEWDDTALVHATMADLADRPGLVDWPEVERLRLLLAEAAAGRLLIVQAGDCAEDPNECTPDFLARKVTLLSALTEAMRASTGLPAIAVGRMAGQFAKPRSRQTEVCDGVELPVFRGLIVNAPEPDPARRRPDPRRMVTCYRAAHSAAAYLRRHSQVWTSHEALLLDYELPLIRRDEAGRLLLTSTHWPWIGERTRGLDDAHVNLLAQVRNPVACKIGPHISVDELLALCERLDPEREPGRLTLIARLGAGRTIERLPGLVAAVRSAGHPVIWMCDPMHANTVKAPGGRKTRVLTTILREVHEFHAAVSGAGVAGGVHLETTPEPVVECVRNESELGRAGGRSTTLCDPRLNPEQAVRVATAWGRQRAAVEQTNRLTFSAPSVPTTSR